MRRFRTDDASHGDAPVRVLLDLLPRDGAALRAGTVRLSPDQRVPEEGLSRHAVDELALIVAGSLQAESGGEDAELTAGDVTLIPAGEAHWARAGEDGAEIFWVWFGDVAREDAASSAATEDRPG
jgi:quercetin dioxygenase-like cupin family protein